MLIYKMKVRDNMKEFYKNHLIIRILAKIVIVILIFIIIVFLVLNFWPPLGRKPNKHDRENYASRASNYKDGKFQNEAHFELIHNTNEKNIFLSTKESTPKETLKAEKPTFLENPTNEDLTITWFGHSTTLIQMSGLNILIDPMFSNYSSPLQGVGPKRFSEIPMEIEELPNIDIVLITHDHYDHLDYKSIKKLKDKASIFIVPLGVEKHLESWGVKKSNIQNLAWWEEYRIGDLTVALTPAKHYSNRSINARFNTLWGSFVLMNEKYKIYESGDTGYGKHFQEIYEKYGEFDLVLLDAGQYNTMWPNVHMFPEESVQAALDLHAKVAMPIHWGTFSLSSHPWDDTVERFVAVSKEASLTKITPNLGHTVNYNEYNLYTNNNWWKEID